MKVCMVVHQSYYSDGRVRRYADTLVDAGAQVDVICVSATDETRVHDVAPVRVYTVPLRRWRGGAASYLLEYGLAFVMYMVRLLILYARNGYDVIHVHNMPDFLVFTAIIPKLFGAKILLDIHDPTPEFFMSKYDAGPDRPMVRLMRFQERLSVQFVDAVITANRGFRKALIERGLPAEKITVIYNFPDPHVFDRERFQGNRPVNGDVFTMVYPGTLDARYGLHVAVEALPLIREEVPGIRLHLIGQQVPYSDELAQMAQELGVDDLLELEGLLPIQDVPDRLSRANVGIYPSLPNPYMELAVPTKVFEYAAMGLPVVASRMKMLEDLYPDGSLMYFEPGQANDFARCIITLYHDPELRESLVRTADQTLLQNYDWNAEREDYLALLGQLVPGGIETTPAH
jgi:glycosyltransferase involved in cell wall biosynthesis